MIISDAIKNVKANSKEKFDATVEVHINLDIDPEKQDQVIRFTTVLPNGTGKTKKVAVMASKKIEGADLELSESDIEKLISGKIKPKVDFDVLIVEPKYMSNLAKAARVLGPAGVMPNPKTGTVTEDVAKALAQTKKGKIEVKNEKDGKLIHTIIGKVSFTEKQLEENLKDLLNSLKQNKPNKVKPDWIKSISICSSMGKSYGIDTSEL